MGQNLMFRIGIALLTLGTATTTWAQSYSWNTVTLGGSGFVSGMLTSPTKQNLIFARTDVGGAYRWNEANQGWIPITDWVSDADKGLLGVESFATDPQKPNKVYLLLGTSYYSGGKTVIARSNDTGATFQYTEVTSQFTAMGNGSNRNTGEKLVVDPNNSAILFCGSRSKGLFKSSDSGVTWQSVTSLAVSTTYNGNGISFVQFDKSTGSAGSATQTIYVGVQNQGSTNFYVSVNGGTAWNPVSGAPTKYMPERTSLASDGKMYITYGDTANDSGAVYKFDTKAAASAWTNITPSSMTGRAFGGVSVDASNASRILVSTFSQWMQQDWEANNDVWGDHILLSTNGGTSWTDLFAVGAYSFNTNGFPWIKDHALHWAGCVMIDPFNSNRAFSTSGNGLFSTTNLSSANTTWNFAVKGIEESVPLGFISLPGGPFFDVIGDYDGEITSNLTVSPTNGTHTPGMGTTGSLAFAWLKPTTIARAANNTIYYSENTGTAWTSLTMPSTESTNDLALSADGKTLLWATGSSTVHRTSSATKGATWTTVSGLSNKATIVPDAVNSAKFYSYYPNTGAFYASTDSGKTFALTTTITSWGNGRARAVPGVEGDVWVALAGNGLTRSTNSGSSFTKVSLVTYCNQVGFGKAATGKTYPAVYIWGTVNSINGIFRSDDAGTTWTRINDTQHQFGGLGNAQLIDGDMNTYGRVYMSTVGRGVIYGTYSATSSSSSVFSSSIASSSSVSSSSVVVSSSSSVVSSSSKASSSSVAVSSSSVVASSSSKASSSSVAVSSSSAVVSSSSITHTTQILSQNFADIQSQAAFFRVYDLMGHQVQMSTQVPTHLQPGHWIVSAFDANGQRLASTLRISE